MKKSRFSSKAITIMALGIAINVVLGTIVNMIKIPLLFLDTVGTIFTAVVLGPLAGAIVGGLTNVILSFSSPLEMLFAIVNIAIGIIVGLIAKQFGFKVRTAIISGLIIAVVAPLIGTPIAVYVYGGVTGDGNDLIFAWLLASGQKIFTAAFIPRITGNLIDKVASCALVSLVISNLPSSLLQGFKE